MCHSFSEISAVVHVSHSLLLLYIYLMHTYLCSGDDEVLADVWQLTWTPENGDERDCPGPYFSFVHLHGVLMYAAWGLMLPLGALLGRYYRRYWPVWFILHIIVQVKTRAADTRNVCTQW